MAAGAMIAGGFMGLESMKGGAQSAPEQAEVSPTIQSLVLNEHANLRFDPYVADMDANNLVLPAAFNPASVEIVNQGRTYVLHDTENGTWYGVSGSAVRDAFGGQFPMDVVDRIKDDNDGIIWVNEQGVADVRTVEEAAAFVDQQLPMVEPLDDENTLPSPETR